jgi:hypothetical protein
LLEDSTIDNPEYAVIKNYDETLKAPTSHENEIIQEVFIPAEETKKINDEYTELIRKRS